jgi:carboxymethylenebutenolidase
MGEMVRVPAQPSDLDAYLAMPAGRPRGAVLVLPARYGLEPGYLELSDRLAGQGYAALGMNWQTREQDPTTATSVADIRAARVFLQEQTDSPLGIVGFCRGGTLVFWAMSDDPTWKAGVALYSLPKRPSPSDPESVSLWDVPSPQGDVLILHGAEDPVATMEEIVDYCRKLSNDGTLYELKMYSGAGHRFFLPTDQGYIQRVADDCWAELNRFFERSLVGSRDGSAGAAGQRAGQAER